jgi:hypothetical protein
LAAFSASLRFFSAYFSGLSTASFTSASTSKRDWLVAFACLVIAAWLVWAAASQGP